MRVLLAVDHSTACDAAIEYLKNLRFTKPIDLDVLTVIFPGPFADARGVGAPKTEPSVLEEETEFVKAKLGETVARFQGDAFKAVTGVLKVGTPGQEIRAFADAQKSDLIVLGALGHSALSRILLGSVSDFVASTHTASSVLVVRPYISSTTHSPRRLLLAVDCTDRDQTLAKWVRQLKLPDDAEIHLVHVMRVMPFLSPRAIEGAKALGDKSQADAERTMRGLAAKFRLSGYQVVTSVMRAPHPGDALITYAQKHDCDIIITGDTHRSTASRQLLGSTSRDIMRHATCSVLIARDQ